MNKLRGKTYVSSDHDQMGGHSFLRDTRDAASAKGQDTIS